MIKQFQDAYSDSYYKSNVWRSDSPDFTKIAKAYGIESYSITKQKEVDVGLSYCGRIQICLSC